MPRLIVAALKAPIRLWQLSFSLILPPTCRFTPSCSAYALTALDRHGPWHGSILAARRLARCHPWGGAGYDPVPAACKGAPPHESPPA